MQCRVHPLNALGDYRYVVVIARHDDAWLLCRHQARHTWETAGGHIEAGETPMEAARRELYEETGALDFAIEPVFDYWAADDGVVRDGVADGVTEANRGRLAADTVSEANGMVFCAEIAQMGPLPESEMAEVGHFQALPETLTYPDITPLLFAHLDEMRRNGKG